MLHNFSHWWTRSYGLEGIGGRKNEVVFPGLKGTDLSSLHFIYSDCIRQGEQSLQFVVNVRKIEKKSNEKVRNNWNNFESFLLCFVLFSETKKISFLFKYLRARRISKVTKQGKIYDLCICNYMSYFISMYNFSVKLQIYKRKWLSLLWAIIKTKQTVSLQINPGFFKYFFFHFSYKNKT